MAHTDTSTVLEAPDHRDRSPNSRDERGVPRHSAADTPAGRPEPSNASPTVRAAVVDGILRRRACLPAAHPDRPRLRGQAVEAALPLVGYLARRYAGCGESIEDLEQVAAVGLLKAIDGFDPEYANNFWSYATPTILGTLKRHFRDRSWAVGVPRRYKELWLEINRCRNDMAQRLRRPPVLAELIEQLGEDRKHITWALMAEKGRSCTSLFTPLNGQDEGTALIDEIGQSEPGYDRVDLHECLLSALAWLPPRERHIVTSRFYGTMTQSQIAAELGISQMHVSRLLACALRRLRTMLHDVY